MLTGDDTNIEARGEDGMSARVWKRQEGNLRLDGTNHEA